MKEHPILFSAPMVRAILAGRKTQTRRPIKPQPSGDWNPTVGVYAPTLVDEFDVEYPGDDVFGASDENEGRVSPYGAPGDRLWVRETVWLWCEKSPNGVGSVGQRKLRYTAVGNPPVYAEDSPSKPVFEYPNKHRNGNEVVWHHISSIHMPRWASRITLEITDVRVERVQEISEEDARAEGIINGGCLNCGEDEPCGCGNPQPSPIDTFVRLWDSIYAKRGMGWTANPWCWVYDLKEIEK